MTRSRCHQNQRIRSIPIPGVRENIEPTVRRCRRSSKSVHSDLPPAIGVFRITPEQRRQQIFPYYMPTKDCILVYFSAVTLIYMFFYFQAHALEDKLPYDARDSLTAFWIWWIFFCNFGSECILVSTHLCTHVFGEVETENGRVGSRFWGV